MNNLPIPGIVLGVSVAVLLCIIVSIVLGVLIYTCRRGYSSTHEEMIPLTQEIEMKNNMDTDLMNARLFLRSTTYNLDVPFFEIGRHTKKQFLCTNKLDSSQILMVMIEKDLTSLVPQNEKIHFLSLMRELSHPLIEKVEGCELGNNKCVIYHKWNPKGSLRDFIYKANPSYSYQTKYYHGIPLLPNYIMYFGKQILMAINALDAIGCRFCVSTGNILLCGNQIKLTELENHFLKMPHPYENWIRKDPILSFGHVLFEMVTGAALESEQLHDLEKFPIEKNILRVLKNIFEGNYQTVEKILEEKIFTDVVVDPVFKESILNITEKKRRFF